MASFVVRSEDLVKVANFAEETKAKIRAIVQENSVIEKDGKKVSQASYYSKTDTLTMTAYNRNDGLKAIQGLGFFSDKILALGVSHIRIAASPLINVVDNRTAAKEQLHDTMVELLRAPSETTNGDLIANNIKVTLYGQSEGVQFWEYFKCEFAGVYRGVMDLSEKTPYSSKEHGVLFLFFNTYYINFPHFLVFTYTQFFLVQSQPVRVQRGLYKCESHRIATLPLFTNNKKFILFQDAV
ncbi:hypothetical protein [Sporosarcina luteola]|uniref:hypothetical protein n=1 Tax=Sporosarcina luteola TaxID=582850 RepID=UPI00203B8B2C|nr:hypothetical protein [Sporosarcina luteola]MCM3709107.1 hypothetical protein [Sporosarcina luteola]